jgi:predicted transcriptional regulator
MKCRLLYLHPETNPGKIERLESLHREYVAYVRICIQHMLDKRRYTLKKSEKQAFFPPSETLTSQIVKNARDHAIQIVSTWAKSVYARKIQKTISNLRRESSLTEDEAKALYIVGKRLIGVPWKFITQQDIDAYNALLDRYGGNKPQVRANLPMWLSEMTGRLEDPEEALLPAFWLRVSSLEV